MLRTMVCAFCLTLAVAAGLTLSSHPSLAGALSITDADPIAVVTVPDDWSTSKITRGLQIKTPDDEIYIWFELIPPGEIDAVQKEHNGYFDKEGVTITGASETVKKEINGRAWSFTELKAKSSDGDSVIRYVAINPNVASGKIIMMTYWASLEGDKEYDAAMNQMFKSIAFK